MVLCEKVYAHWKLNESSGDVVDDATTNNRDGLRVNMEDGDWVPGKLNNGLQFDGVNEYVNFSQIAAFERTDSFSIEFWIKTGTAANVAVFSNITSVGGQFRGWQVAVQGTDNRKLRVNFLSNNTSRIIIETNSGIGNNIWTHVVITYNGNSLATGFKIYINNVNTAFSVIQNNLTTSTVVTYDLTMGYAPNYSAFAGILDEVVIYDDELSVGEVAYRYNGGAGTEVFGNAPNAPNTPNPTNGESSVEYNRILEWDCSHPDGLALTYDVYLDTINPPVSLVATDVAVKEYDPGNYDALVTYYWRIVAKDLCGSSTSGPTWSFDTRNEPPITPNTPSPSNNSIGQGLTVTLSWDSGDLNPGDTVTYDIYFGTASNPPLVKSNHPAKTYALPPLSYDTQYYWKIVAKDNHGEMTTGPIWKFRTQEEGLSGYTGFDVRETIREYFCRVKYEPGSEVTVYYFYVNDERGDEIHIPMYLSEEVRSKELKEMPFLDMNLADSTFEVHDIGGATRRKEAYIDIGLWYTDIDRIDRTAFAHDVINKLIDYIRSHQHDFTGIDFINVESVRLIREPMAHQVVYHWVITVFCWYYDYC